MTTTCISYNKMDGGLAQLARAPALQAGGHRFESDILHTDAESIKGSLTYVAIETIETSNERT